MAESSGRIDRIRAWLDNNKIFFETLTAVLLTVMAIVVSLEANQIASYQTDIMKYEKLPIIHVDVSQMYDPIKQNYARDELTISNIGAPLMEFDFREAIFFKIRYGPINNLTTALVPITGYYSVNIVTKDAVGELARLRNLELTEGNNYKANNVSRVFSEFAQRRNALGIADVVRYIKVIYKDVYGEVHIEYYVTSPLTTYRLNEEDGKEIFDEDMNNIRYNIDFNSEISSDMLYDKWLILQNR